MIKGSDIIGVPIVSLANGDGERVSNWIVDTQTNRILGFLVAQGGWSGSAKVLLWENVESISADGLQVDNSSPIIEISKVMKVKQVLEEQTRLIGLDVITQQGRHLGKVMDLFFNEQNGAVSGLAVSGHDENDGLVAMHFIPVDGTLNIINNFIIITTEMLDAVQPISMPYSGFNPEDDF